MPKLPLLIFSLFAVSAPASVEAVERYSYQVLDKQPLSRALFTQGFEIHDQQLYVSSGKYGKSRLLRFDLASGELETAKNLSFRYFAEGLTVLDKKVFQLTWRSKRMLVYTKSAFESIGAYTLPGEGWGLTNDGSSLIFSDGSATLSFMEPSSGKITKTITVRENGRPLKRLNELEWINGSIWANVWLTDRIVIIDPATGSVTASIDLENLLPEQERIAGTDVLNGIAFDKSNGAIWVTGKHWPWRYHIALKPASGSKQAQSTTLSR
ncbi:MAG: glutaminyl-peptide cyclotransferase [Halioglobus sp.]